MTLLAQSPLILLRKLRPDDLDAFLAYRSDAQVARYQNWEKMSRDRALGFLIHAESDPVFTPGAWSQIAIANPADTLLGDMGLKLSENRTEVELGITLARAHWGKGLAKTAMRLCIDLVWSDTPAQAIRCWGDQRNTRSVALMRSLGMTHLGTETTDVVEEAFILHRPEAG